MMFGRYLFLRLRRGNVMPNILKRPCLYPGCSALTVAGYCEKHKRHTIYNSQRNETREQSFYSSKEWRITSRQFRAMHPNCYICGKPTRIAHHDPELKELFRLGLNPLDWKYLRAVCWSCHERTKGGRG